MLSTLKNIPSFRRSSSSSSGSGWDIEQGRSAALGKTLPLFKLKKTGFIPGLGGFTLETNTNANSILVNTSLYNKCVEVFTMDSLPTLTANKTVSGYVVVDTDGEKLGLIQIPAPKTVLVSTLDYQYKGSLEEKDTFVLRDSHSQAVVLSCRKTTLGLEVEADDFCLRKDWIALSKFRNFKVIEANTNANDLVVSTILASVVL